MRHDWSAQLRTVEILVGVNGGPQSEDALALALAVSKSLNASIAVANIYPVAYNYPSKAHIDAEWRKFLAEDAEIVLDDARRKFGDDEAAITYATHGDRSSGVGLADLAARRGSSIIVIGSSPGGAHDRIHGGSTSDQLLHGSPVPVAIAPYGYRLWAPKEIQRAVIAYHNNRESDFCIKYVVRGLQEARVDFNSRLHLVTLMSAMPRRLRASESDKKSDIVAALRAQAEDALAAGQSVVRKLGSSDSDVAASVLEAEDVTRALSRFDWQDEDVLVVGSTGVGPLRRVFLGDMTYKLIGASTVPVVVVPRSATAHE